MGMKTAGYLLFTIACLIGAAVLGLRGAVSRQNDDAQIAAAMPPVPRSPTPPIGSATRPVIVPTPVPPPPPPQPAVNDPTAAARMMLMLPSRMTREVFANVVEKRPWQVRMAELSKRPILTPAEIRKQPILRRPSTRPAIAISGLVEVPPFAVTLDPPKPEIIVLATGRRFAVSTFSQPLPLIRLPLVLRPKPEPLPPQGPPILDVHGTGQLPLLPSFRATPAPPAISASVTDRKDDVQSKPVPDDDPPGGTRALLPRETMPAGK